MNCSSGTMCFPRVRRALDRQIKSRVPGPARFRLRTFQSRIIYQASCRTLRPRPSGIDRSTRSHSSGDGGGGGRGRGFEIVVYTGCRHSREIIRIANNPSEFSRRCKELKARFTTRHGPLSSIPFNLVLLARETNKNLPRRDFREREESPAAEFCPRDYFSAARRGRSNKCTIR